jgi:pimeloyl-ACP methyl ester carboxylesterase
MIEHRRLAANGLTFHLAEAGRGRPRLILFLHGFPEFWYAWRKQLEGLGDVFHAVAPDMRGVGLSDKPQDVEAYRLDHLVADVAALVRALEHESCILVGHDWGGFVAWETAIRHPELVEKLAIVNCAHPAAFDRLMREDEAQRQVSQYMLAFRSERGEELLSRDGFERFERNILAPGLAAGHLTEVDAAAYREAWRIPGALTGGLNYYRANKTGPDLAGALALGDAQVRVPTLVLWGERDPYFALHNLDLLPDYVPDLRIRRWPDRDHWIVHQVPDEITAAIQEFVTRSS